MKHCHYLGFAVLGWPWNKETTCVPRPENSTHEPRIIIWLHTSCSHPGQIDDGATQLPCPDKLRIGLLPKRFVQFKNNFPLLIGPVAQWIRHRPTELGIAGSNPAGVILWHCFLLCFLGGIPSFLHTVAAGVNVFCAYIMFQ